MKTLMGLIIFTMAFIALPGALLLGSIDGAAQGTIKRPNWLAWLPLPIFIPFWCAWELPGCYYRLFTTDEVIEC
jgi:hypothetical protein